MTHEDLSVGDKVMYQDTDEKVQAQVMKIEDGYVHFKDWDDFEWQEEFKDIPETVLRKL